MTATILLTGFGPFPGAPFNPTGPLVTRAGAPPHPGLARPAPRRPCVSGQLRGGGSRAAGAARARAARRAPHVRARVAPPAHQHRDAGPQCGDRARCRTSSGHRPAASVIEPAAGAALPLRAPAQRLVAAVRAAGLAAARSGDAGSYLCNYLCWRAGEAAARAGGPRLVAFVHVPNVQMTNVRVPAASADSTRGGRARGRRSRSTISPVRARRSCVPRSRQRR